MEDQGREGTRALGGARQMNANRKPHHAKPRLTANVEVARVQARAGAPHQMIPRSGMLVVPWLILSEEPSTLFAAKLFISAIGFIVLCLGARLYLLARRRERSL